MEKVIGKKLYMSHHMRADLSIANSQASPSLSDEEGKHHDPHAWRPACGADQGTAKFRLV